MDPRLAPLAPFVYFGRRYHQLGESLHLDGPAQRSAYNLWRVFDGTMLLHRPHGHQILRPGEVAITEPGTTVELSPQVRVHHLAFDVVYRPRYAKHHGCVIDVRMPRQPTWEELFDRPLPTEPPDRWCQTAIRFVDQAEEVYWRGPAEHLQVNARLHLLLTRLLAWQLDEASPAARDDLVAAAERLIAARAWFGLTVAELAELLGVSRAYLTRRFCQCRNHGPGKALTRQRVHLACHLLETAPDRDLETIATDCGFSGAAVLRRVFARELGMSPSQWRRRARLTTSPDVD